MKAISVMVIMEITTDNIHHIGMVKFYYFLFIKEYEI